MQKLWNMQTLEEWTGACRIETFLKPKRRDRSQIINDRSSTLLMQLHIELSGWIYAPRGQYIFSPDWVDPLNDPGFGVGRALDAHAHLGGERNVENNIAAVSFFRGPIVGDRGRSAKAIHFVRRIETILNENVRPSSLQGYQLAFAAASYFPPVLNVTCHPVLIPSHPFPFSDHIIRNNNNKREREREEKRVLWMGTNGMRQFFRTVVCYDPTSPRYALFFFDGKNLILFSQKKGWKHEKRTMIYERHFLPDFPISFYGENEKKSDGPFVNLNGQQTV